MASGTALLRKEARAIENQLDVKLVSYSRLDGGGPSSAPGGAPPAQLQREAEQLLNLKGHRSVGGMRASIYNAVEQSSVDALCDFMHRFETKYG